jgi:hypothetical protein
MAELLNIKDIVNIIPVLLEYLVPGFIFLTIRNFSFSKDHTKDKYILVKAIVISSLFLELINPILFPVAKYVKIKDEIIPYIFIFLVTAISILYIKLKIEDKLISLLGSTKTPNEDYFENIINTKNGAWMRAYLPEEKVIYMGKLKFYDDKDTGENRKIALACFSSYSYDNDLIESHENDTDSLVLLTMKDIKRIEIFN